MDLASKFPKPRCLSVRCVECIFVCAFIVFQVISSVSFCVPGGSAITVSRSMHAISHFVVGSIVGDASIYACVPKIWSPLTVYKYIYIRIYDIDLQSTRNTYLYCIQISIFYIFFIGFPFQGYHTKIGPQQPTVSSGNF